MPPESTLKTILPEDLDRILEHNNVVLVDVLPPEHFEQRHIPGSVNACVYEVTFPEQMEALVAGLDQPIVLYGSSLRSMDALTAAEKLMRLGYRDISCIRGGLEAWIKAGYDLEGSNPDSPDLDENSLRLDNRTYTVDTQQSVIEWTGRNPNSKHHGIIQLAGGTITARGGTFTGSFEINMKSIKNIDLEGDELQPVLISHLKSDDFFFVKMFPKATFTIDAALPVEKSFPSTPNFLLKGQLELRGIRNELEVPATVSNLSNGEIALESHFDLDRTRWDVIYGSSRFFEHLGMHLVFDFISIQARIVAR